MSDPTIKPVACRLCGGSPEAHPFNPKFVTCSTPSCIAHYYGERWVSVDAWNYQMRLPPKEELVAALKPFAEMAGGFHESTKDCRVVYTFNRKGFTVGDLRRVAKLFLELGGKLNE